MAMPMIGGPLDGDWLPAMGETGPLVMGTVVRESVYGYAMAGGVWWHVSTERRGSADDAWLFVFSGCHWRAEVVGEMVGEAERLSRVWRRECRGKAGE